MNSDEAHRSEYDEDDDVFADEDGDVVDEGDMGEEGMDEGDMDEEGMGEEDMGGAANQILLEDDS
ncbi:hypothetical protein EV174_006102, partial [Coemansia sp. RSA 2320]